MFKSVIKIFRQNSKVCELNELYLDILKYYLNHQVKCSEIVWHQIDKQLKHELVKLGNIDSRLSLNYGTHTVTPGPSQSDTLRIYESASSFGLIIKFFTSIPVSFS